MQLVKPGAIRAHRGDWQRYFRSLSGPHSAVVKSAPLLVLARPHLAWTRMSLSPWPMPGSLKAIAAAKVKTDPRRCPHHLAQLIPADLNPEAHMVSTELRPDRDLLLTRLRLVQRRVGAKNSIAPVLEKYNVPSPDELPPLPFLQGGLFQDQVSFWASRSASGGPSGRAPLPRIPTLQRLLQIPGIGRMGLSAPDPRDRPTIQTDSPRQRHFHSHMQARPGGRTTQGSAPAIARSKEGNRYLKLSLLPCGPSGPSSITTRSGPST